MTIGAFQGIHQNNYRQDNLWSNSPSRQLIGIRRISKEESSPLPSGPRTTLTAKLNALPKPANQYDLKNCNPPRKQGRIVAATKWSDDDLHSNAEKFLVQRRLKGSAWPAAAAKLKSIADGAKWFTLKNFSVNHVRGFDSGVLH
ncbi:hypothetical protein [Aureliella helgolandensis]|uniref:Uncharacterized protein n=1 Tax=Aureliella helgolandensis TaxID=2527968 RepID=A0A518GGS2_9BACT|nr:hypothetical protein [Aureliella helgolandensis]QDV27777.1 hypothetical protein Q31a_61700 [Aureliella helgolandensis]